MMKLLIFFIWWACLAIVFGMAVAYFCIPKSRDGQ
jgi:Na+/H+-dicarboxylate symporter